MGSENSQQAAQSLHSLLEALLLSLVTKGETIATAESCTAGMLSSELTRLPGSSKIFLGGVASYANEAKVALLGISDELISSKGAVSAEVAEEMASQIRKRLDADYGLSLSGIAGPDGGSKDKPVGHVWCGLSTRAFNKSQCFKMYDLSQSYQGEALRQKVRELSTFKALKWLLEEIQQS